MRPLWLMALVACSCTFDYGTLKGKAPASDGAADAPAALADGADGPEGRGGSTGSDAGVGRTVGSGGAIADGRWGTGGVIATGGGNGTGGIVVTGGKLGSGGTLAMGGLVGSGGATGGTGGIPGSGGVTSLGGATGPGGIGSGGIVAGGGTVATGGKLASGGIPATGGVTSAGGLTGSGGATGMTGGIPGSGGVTSSGGAASSGGSSGGTTGTLRVDYLSNNSAAVTGTIDLKVDVTNTGSNRISFSSGTLLTLRYWFSDESPSLANYVDFNYVALGAGMASGSFVSGQSRTGGDTYLEIRFNLGDLPAGGNTGVTSLLIRKLAYDAVFVQANDYSYVTATGSVLQPNPKITAYIGNTLAWGTEPPPQ